jgi:hypothetical protein
MQQLCKTRIAAQIKQGESFESELVKADVLGTGRAVSGVGCGLCTELLLPMSSISLKRVVAERAGCRQESMVTIKHSDRIPME